MHLVIGRTRVKAETLTIKGFLYLRCVYPAYFAERYTSDTLTLFRMFNYPPGKSSPDKKS